MRILIGLVFSCIVTITFAQRDITVEGIWRDYTFYARSVPGFNFMQDGKHYTRLEDNKIKKYDLTSGDFVEDLFVSGNDKSADGMVGQISSYTFNNDESLILIESQSDQIYRRSSKGLVYVYNRKAQTTTAIQEGVKISNASLSPKGDKVAYVFENNIYIYDIPSSAIIQVTDDGKYNEIINGMCDWVYEEEFSFTKAFEWSPDGTKIGFIRFDERQVPEFTMTVNTDQVYPEYITFKYPKVGEKNAVVDVYVYDVKSSKSVKVDRDENWEYVPRIKWSPRNQLVVYNMNRHQNHLQLDLVNPKTGKGTPMLVEKNKYYIDITDDLRFLDNGDKYIWSSEKSGYNHLYVYDKQGNELNALTSGEYDVTSFYGYDQKNKRVYYQAAKEKPSQKEIYSVGIKGRKDKKHSKQEGTNRAQFSSTFDYYVLNHSTANYPPTYEVYNRKDKKVRTIENNRALRQIQKDYGVEDIKFMDIQTRKDVNLKAWMMLPKDFDESKQYPVFMYLYGGPGSQQVTDAWKGQNYWWFQMLAQQGYIVACVDNRGTGARGEDFKKMTYQQLGHYETIDQIESAKYLASLPYTDASRIGIFGWSYGGYMSSLCLLKGNDIFKAAIAVAPVTNWKWYDTIYTERYMRTSEENPDGYHDNSPIYFADQLKGNYLLVHGDGDDNVHVQNSMEMARALISANKQFDFYIYPNRNHGIYGDNARLHLYTKMTNFIKEKL